MFIHYKINTPISSESFIDILERSGLANRRPIDSPLIIEKMIENANLIITVWNENNNLIGIARCLTDYAYCCYLSCLAVDKAYKGQGIGKKLISKILEKIGPTSMLLLLSAPGTEGFYQTVGFELSQNSYIIRRGEVHLNVLKQLKEDKE